MGFRTFSGVSFSDGFPKNPDVFVKYVDVEHDCVWNAPTRVRVFRYVLTCSEPQLGILAIMCINKKMFPKRYTNFYMEKCSLLAKNVQHLSS